MVNSENMESDFQMNVDDFTRMSSTFLMKNKYQTLESIEGYSSALTVRGYDFEMYALKITAYSSGLSRISNEHI